MAAKVWTRIVGIFVSIFFLALSGQAFAQTTVTKFELKGDTAFAFFDTIDPNDPESCIENIVVVAAADQIEKTSDGGKTPALRVALMVIQVDSCTSTVLFIGAGDTTVAALKIASNLKSATLEADVEVIDSVSTLGFIFHVSLEWSATGKAETENFKELFNDGTTRITSFTHTKQGEAIAQGSVELNGYNYTPEASTEGTIGREKDRTLIIEKLR